MQNRLGLNGSTVPKADLETGIQAAKNGGFAFYEPRVPMLKECEKRDGTDSAREKLRESTLQWLPLNALEDVFFLPESELDERAERIFAQAERFGIDRVIVVPGRTGDAPLPRPEAEKQLLKLKERASAHSVSLVYELIGFPVHHFPTLSKARAVADSARLSLVLDTFHLAVSRTPPEEVASLPAKAIGHVHLSDAITENKGPDTIGDEDRVLPGEGGLELVEYMKAIKDTGYDGAVSVEVFHTKYGERDPDEVARNAMERTVRLLKEAGWSA